MLSIWLVYLGSYKTMKSFALGKNEWPDIYNVQSKMNDNHVKKQANNFGEVLYDLSFS